MLFLCIIFMYFVYIKVNKESKNEKKIFIFNRDLVNLDNAS